MQQKANSTLTNHYNYITAVVNALSFQLKHCWTNNVTPVHTVALTHTANWNNNLQCQ